MEDDDEEMDSDERMKIKGNINFPKQGLPTRKGDEEGDSGVDLHG
jgi:hypothetical protein